MKCYKLLLTILPALLILSGCSDTDSSTAKRKKLTKKEINYIVEFDKPVPSIPSGLRISTFDTDATPPPGTWLAYDSLLNTGDLGLRAKGLVILGAGEPIVICCVDWLGISNAGYDSFRRSLGNAAGTSPERVSIHTVHQHDAPNCDFTVEKILLDAGVDPACFEGTFHREFIRKLSYVVRNSLEKSQPVTHIGTGRGIVDRVASNRRILGENGKVIGTRWTTTKDPALRALPEGLIDPEVSVVSLWNNDDPLAVLSFYASHPQSYYRTGIANPDFPGIARFFRQLEVPDALHIHFNGAGGNIGAGKYNDGAHENRLILAQRLAEGMKLAWESTVKEEITPESVRWNYIPVSLPPAKHLLELEKRMTEISDTLYSHSLASKLAWLERTRAGIKTDVSCLSAENTRILFLPGELFVEYQLTARSMRKDLFVAMASYGEYGMGYIGTAAAYDEGGYETGDESFVDSGSETILMDAISRLLGNR
ncbi:MAG TPA: hypothetical protein PLO24_01760 [Bacteroidales bacterium]|jgi:hypothetical protein|nr:hypothetical protein [Bacteroidales bacterium]HOS71445.1 hypothetical protein [Bacteroidales bacterium]HQH25059.1 hypothetical protein [Bacteroidales bacterium]HQJ82417.1 hypothetical protein [Bacteroidales bacterium]